MPEALAKDIGALVTHKIISDGSVLPEGMLVLSIEIDNDCNRIPVARITFIDGSPETGKFDVSDSGALDWGKEIDIQIGRMGKEDSLFTGVIVGKHLQAGSSGSTLVVEASDKAIRMTGVRKSKVFAGKTDSAVMEDLIKGNGLSPSVESTAIEHPTLVQYYTSDWDFLLCRAEANRMVVLVADGKVTVKKPDLSLSPRYEYSYGNDLYSFRLESDLRPLNDTVTGSHWDIKSQQVMQSAKAADFTLANGNIDAKALAVMGNAKSDLFTGTSLDEGEGKAWADAYMARRNLSALSGTLELDGHNVVPGNMISLEGVAKAHSGAIFVTGVSQIVSGGNWITRVHSGVPPDSFSVRYPVRDEAAAGLLPGVNGLQIGIVQAFQEDPDGFFRFKVAVPAMGNQENFVWARLTTLSGGKDHGFVFFPEKDDEVILGFMNDDPRQAVILGSVYNPKAPPAFTPTEKNYEKGILTKQKTKLVFNDEKKTITLSTENQQIVIDEEKKSVTIRDMNENSITLDDKGITLKSAKDLILDAGGDLKINASGNVEIKGSKVDVV